MLITCVTIIGLITRVSNLATDTTDVLQKYICPQGAPLWLTSRPIWDKSSFDTSCLMRGDLKSTYENCSTSSNEFRWISGMECLTENGHLHNFSCTFHCGSSKSVRLKKCRWNKLENSQEVVDQSTTILRNILLNSSRIYVEVCQVEKLQVENNNIWRTPLTPLSVFRDDPDPFEPDLPPVTVKPTPEVKGFKPPISHSKYDFHCETKGSPARINAASLKKLNGLYCGNPYPCSTECRVGSSCVYRQRFDDFITDFDCFAEDNEDEPYKCNFTCCHSNVIKLHNCTWQYQTDGIIEKGNGTEIVVRRVEFFPYVLEVCAVRKLNDSDDHNGSACDWSLYSNVAPFQQPVDVATDTGAEQFVNPFYGYCATLDIYFILDSSHSLFTSGFANEKTFLSDLIGLFNFQPQPTDEEDLTNRVGLISFGYQAVLNWDLTKYQSDTSANTNLATAVAGLNFLDSAYSNLIGAIQLTTKMFTQQPKRSGVRRVVVVITDGLPTSAAKITESVRLQRYKVATKSLYAQTGEDIYAATIGTEGRTFTDKYGIPSDHVLNAVTSRELAGLADDMFSIICADPNYYDSSGDSSNNDYYMYN